MKPLNDVTRQAIEVLTKEIGVADTIRFVNQFTTGYGNYTEEREKLFEGVGLDDILGKIRETRNGRDGE